MRLTVSLLIATFCWLTSAYTTIPRLAFAPPYEDLSAEGLRYISNWNTGGNTLDIKENFIRLTPSRQNSFGYLWAQTPLKDNEWTATLHFRISGSSKRLYGDGIALFFTAHSRYRNGSIHRFTDKFNGFGLIFDTYKNQAPGVFHKDVLFLASDGTSPITSVVDGGSTDANAIGCADEFRFWEGRNDFSVTNHSVARIVYKDQKVSVYLDGKGSGNWKTCFENAEVPASLPNGGYFGIIGSTGDLSDSHDIISFQVSSTEEYAPNPFLSMVSSPPDVVFSGTGDSKIDDAIREALQKQALKFQSDLSTLKQELEHQFSSLDEHTASTMKKFKETDNSAEKRISDLEKRLSTVMDQKLDATLSNRISRIEQLLDSKIETVSNEVNQKVQSANKGWLLPFIVLVVVLAVAAVLGLRQYRKFKKLHLL